MAQNDHSEVYIIPPNFVKEAICCERVILLYRSILHSHRNSTQKLYAVKGG